MRGLPASVPGRNRPDTWQPKPMSSAIHADRSRPCLRRAALRAVPVLLLYLVFRRIDFAQLRQYLAGANPGLVALGLAYYPAMIALAAWRWRFLAGRYGCGGLGAWASLKHYWIGFATGLLAPSTLGLDSYRVIVNGRLGGRYGLNVAVVFAEKVLVLLTCVSLILALYPLVPARPGPEMDRVLQVAFVIFLAGVALVLALLASRRSRIAGRLLERLEQGLSENLARTIRRVAPRAADSELRLPLRESLAPLSRAGTLAAFLAFTVSIQAVCAAGNQLLFQAMGWPVPFAVNLFISPVFFLIFALPVSFSGLGVREAGFVFLYGLFGVPPEIALGASCFSLLGLLLSYAAGGLWLLAPAGAGDQAGQ